MANDKPKYKITVYKNRLTTQGTLYNETFEEIYLRFKNKVKRTKETYNEYISSSKDVQSNIKDVGGFIGGETEGNRRVNGIRITRKLLTLDIDVDEPNILEYLKENIDFYCFIYTTHKHSPEKNRFRIVAPLSREVNPDEYESVGRKIAYLIECKRKENNQSAMFDETTFQANRLMFFPSVSCDGEYICELLNLDMFSDEQNIIDVDNILSMYIDSNDIYEWYKPSLIDSERIGKNVLENKQPLKAKGMVGAFNRTYTVSQAIEKFLPNVYKREKTGRYTYLNGDSYGGGMILNNDTLFYSHHGTDPANMYYRNAFDLVRIHLFGSYDNSMTPEKQMEKGLADKNESFLKMVEFCRTLPEVCEHSESNIELLSKVEKSEQYVNEVFETGKPSEDITVVQKEPDRTWILKLDGEKSIMAKMELIFDNDLVIGNLLYYDTFKDNICFRRRPHWKLPQNFSVGDALQDKDMSHIRVQLEKVYGIKGDSAIEDAVVVEADKIQKNEVLEYFESLTWDGVERLENFMYDFFKVAKNPFTKVAFKHWLVGAVRRIYKAGAPMDLLLVIKGEQGIGKSLFFKKLATRDFNNAGKHLYSDTKIDFDHAKDSYEQLEGVWIYEWKELAGMNMSEQESIKAFIDKTEDKFRRSYGRRNVEIKRRVAFGGSTNDSKPLRDRTGNRRFLVMESGNKRQECYIKDVSKFSNEYKDQLIAEAIYYYKQGFDPLEWTDEELEWWDKTNDVNLAENDYVGIIDNYLNMKKPKNWYSMSMEQMQDYMQNYDFDLDKPKLAIVNEQEIAPLDKCCIQEIWRIALKNRDNKINRYERELIVQALKQSGFEITQSQLRFGVFGQQVSAKRVVK